MNWKIKAVITVVIVGSLVWGAILIHKSHSRPGVTVTLRIAVNPSEQSNFVAAQSNSAKFRYLVGKKAGVKPILAQKLAVRSVPNSSLIEAVIGLTNQDEARRYVEAFLETLQGQCAGQAQVTLSEQSVR